MAWAAKRTMRSKRYTAYFRDEHGIQRQKIGYTSKVATEDLARMLEDEARKIADGLVKRGDRELRAAEARPLSDHIADYRGVIVAMGGTDTHADQIESALKRLFADASVKALSEIAKDRTLTGLMVWKGRGRSARTLNHALGAVKALVRWAVDAGRLEKAPEGLLKLPKYNEDADPHLTRRALTKDEVDRILKAAESGHTLTRQPSTRTPKLTKHGEPSRSGTIGHTRKVQHTGLERAFIYRLAMATGFRANELRTLTPECFRLEGDEPSIVVLAKHSKNGKEAVQPITREMADAFRPFLEGKEQGRPVVVVPEKLAKLLRIDMDAAGIVYGRKRKGVAATGVVDGHALRSTYCTWLLESGANIKIVQILMRHADVKTTMRYVKVTDKGIRDALNNPK